jgi:hypothetical protein
MLVILNCIFLSKAGVSLKLVRLIILEGSCIKSLYAFTLINGRKLSVLNDIMLNALNSGNQQEHRVGNACVRTHIKSFKIAICLNCT